MIKVIMKMRDKLSKFLFPIKSENGELRVEFRFGIFSALIWKIFCFITGEKK